MNNHLFYTLLDNLGEGRAKLSELKHFVREETEPDISIAATFPISNFGSPSDSLRIKGSDKLLTAFEKFEKMDFVESLENLEYMGLTDKDQVILNFKRH